MSDEIAPTNDESSVMLQKRNWLSIAISSLFSGGFALFIAPTIAILMPIRIEDDLVNYIIQRERAFQPLTRQEIHDFAQALSAVNGDVSYIGKNWVDRFVSRHETIEMKPSKVIDAARKRCVTEEMLTE
ncbi:uncharacterized protein FRV6_15617 [Fusarium oxysporum]|uniref:HTH CENPB-type domain-containing protein n=1 Tax=Fusarium oxysporum TaxID=5507 RepID=A0A2H3UC73_FUSOX|nr:uncharacterized protein FRV6_15617 [Fusarium oxysporum]